ncbi:ABC transporter substrate-binding protein [Azospirillum picis]|uniref:Spermidine/putrescine transport system substrate-binding protein n=1 Tax=Azospirillum picis TaxID=488438 RepID=A0ABU0MW56_9PROT|nr:ABC transporter substrate-binding protein [Azospirillum picis]MBP2303595.1 putative spermidine/putrescine transport system substrate-binding protein [Azospirillum picis]MDQ0537434.1 putative spermidine/putrescine transport system substrate-binding protein [Azospirillum picis]
MIKPLLLGAAALAAVFASSVLPAAAAEETAICYNCPPEWADWASQLKAIKADLGITVPFDNKNSGQSLAAMIAEKDRPVADVVYLGGSAGIQAKQAGVVAPFKPTAWADIPDGMKDADGTWFAIHSGTLGFFVNTEALGGKPVPQGWADLLKPDYDGMVGYLDPTSAAVGYVGAVAVNQALGGDYASFDKAIGWFRELQKNQPIVPKQTSYARVLSGEIPILIDYDFNAYRARYVDKAPVAFVIPSEGTVSVPYVMALVKNAPHPETGRKVLDYVLSDKGQTLWANAFMRPVRAEAMSPETAAKFLPAADYARAKPVDLARMAEAQKGFMDRYQAEVK